MVEEFFDGVGGKENVAVGLLGEFFGDGVVEKFQKVIVKSADIEDAARFIVEAEFGPCEHFKEFVEGAVTSRQCNKTIGKFGHERLAFVHGGDNVHVFDIGMRDFVFDKVFCDDAGDFSFERERGVGNFFHQADVAAAVDKRETALGDNLCGVFCGGGVFGTRAAI